MAADLLSYAAGGILIAVAASAIAALRLLAQVVEASMWAEGGLAFVFVTSLLSGIAILWRQNMQERKEHTEAIEEIVSAHRQEIAKLHRELTDRSDSLVQEYRQRLESLERDRG